MSSVSLTSSAPTSSRVWSCATLKDGVNHVAAEAAALEREERELEEQIKAFPRLPKFSHVMFAHLYIYIELFSQL